MQFEQHFTYKKILHASLAPVTMMIFTSLYSVVDGLFLSNFAGKDVFAAVGFITPYLMMFNSAGFMFGTGGSALIAKKLGEKRQRDADEIFSTLVLGSVITGIILAAAAQFFLRPVAGLQGAAVTLLENSIRYGRIYLLGTPACLVQFEFQPLYPASGKSRLGLISALISGFLNIALDALFLAVFSWGITGAAFATVISQWTGGLIPLFFYSRENSSRLRLVKSRFRWHDLLKICGNGSSEMVNNVSISVVSLFYNIQLIRFAGPDGIAAYSIMTYVNFLFTAVFWGYISGTAPIISFHYGAEDYTELRSLLRKSLVIICCCSFTMFVLSELLAVPVSFMYAGYAPELFKMSVHGFRLYSFSFLFAGSSIFLSSFFTSLNNGSLSALLSFSRVFFFQIPAVLILPVFLDLDGIWLSVTSAEILTVLSGIFLLIRNRRRYRY